MSSISEQIIKLRKEYNYNQKDFAKKIGVSQPSLIKFERGETDIIPIGVASKIANELFTSFNELFEIEDSNSFMLKDVISDYTISENRCREDIKKLEKIIEDKEKIIGFLEKEKNRYKKDILHFLEETHDTQTYFLDKYSSLSAFHKKDIQNTIINMMNTIAASYFVTTGLISESELEKIIPKYIGKVRPADTEDKE